MWGNESAILRCSCTLTAILSGAFLTFLPKAASAQTPPAADQSEREGTGLAEIIVTAQKREERLQDVPIAVTAISSEDVTAARIQNITDIGSIAPNVYAVFSPGANAIPQTTIRGLVAGNAATDIVDNGVSYYIDGVYLGQILGQNIDISDIERIEIIRGPAGTLFGTNATGGAINYITSGPRGVLGAKQELSYGRFGSLRSRSRLDLPEWNGLSLSGTYMRNLRRSNVSNRIVRGTDFTRQSGGQYGILTSSRNLGESDTDAVHFAAAFRPSDALSLEYKFDWSHEEQDAPAVQILGFANGGFGQAARATVLAQVASGALRLEDIVNARRLNQVYNDATVPLDVRVRSHVFKAELSVTDWLEVRNITGFRRNLRGPSVNQLDGAGGLRVAGSPLIIVNSTAYALTKQFSSEMQFLVDTERFDLTAGLFYYDRRVPPGFLKPSVPVFGVLTNGVAPGGPPDPFQLTGKLRARSYAGYAQATFALAQNLDISLGARYTHDEKSQFSTAAGPPGKSFEYSDEQPTWLANVQYRPGDGKLMYLKYSTGYISGGFTAGPVVTDPGTGARIQGDSVQYAPEKAKSWEAGLKADWLDRRLRTNLAAFYVDYTNLQFPLFVPISVSVPSGGTIPAFLSAIANAGKSRAYGLEAEISALPVEDLQVDFNAGYTDFDYKELDPAVGQVGVFREVYRPKFNANLALSYSLPELPGGGVPGLRVDASYLSPMNLTSTVYNESYNLFLNDLTRIDSQIILNARAKISEIPVGGGSAEVALWGRNLTNDQSLRFAVDVGTTAGMFNQPVTYGIDVILNF